MTTNAIEFDTIPPVFSAKDLANTDSLLSSTERKTEAVALPSIHASNSPLILSKQIDSKKITDKTSDEKNKDTPTGINEPNPAREMAEGAFSLEKTIKETTIDPLVEEANKIAGTDENKGSIDLLLELSKELSNVDLEKPELSDKAKNLIERLKEHQIDLLDFDDEVEFTKEQLGDLKTRISSYTDVQRTKLQQIFTKIQTEIQNTSSLLDSAKKFIADQERFMQRISDRFLKR